MPVAPTLTSARILTGSGLHRKNTRAWARNYRRCSVDDLRRLGCLPPGGFALVVCDILSVPAPLMFLFNIVSGLLGGCIGGWLCAWSTPAPSCSSALQPKR